MRRTREEAQHTRLLIMQKGLEAFAEQGVSSCSLTEIARSVGCTRGAIYWHFKDKWHLFEAICEFYSLSDNAEPFVDTLIVSLQSLKGFPCNLDPGVEKL